MRRAVLVLPLVALLLVPATARIARAQRNTSVINGIGYLDYSGRPTFKVGDWVRYEVTTTDDNGHTTDVRNMTMLIAGQRILWGERCFYLETWTEKGSSLVGAVGTLLSYSGFDDSLGFDHRQLYQRLIVTQPRGREIEASERLMRPSSLTERTLGDAPDRRTADTLGTDTLLTAKGVLKGLHLRLKSSYDNTQGVGDSTIYRVRDEEHDRWRCADVPITHIARDDETVTLTRKSWLVGRSSQGLPPIIETRGSVTMRVLDYGSGLKSKLLGPERAVSFEQIEAASRRPAAPAKRATTAAKPAARKTT